MYIAKNQEYLTSHNFEWNIHWPTHTAKYVPYMLTKMQSNKMQGNTSTLLALIFDFLTNGSVCAKTQIAVSLFTDYSAGHSS